MLVYAKTDIASSVEVDIPEFDSFNQCCALKMCLNDNSSIVIALVYRPHHIYKDKVPQLECTAENNRLLNALLGKIPCPCVIVGDFNYSNIDWDVMFYASSSEEFVMAVQDNFLSQHIDFPTHSSGTQPDLALSNCPNRILVVENLSKLGDSDHPMMMLTVIGSTVSNTSYEEVPDWRKADLQSIRKELANVDWSACLDNLDTLQTWDFIKEKIKSAEAHCVPMKRRRVTSKTFEE